MALLVAGRLVVMGGIGLLVVFLVAAALFLILVAVKDPLIAAGSWLTVGVIAWLAAKFGRSHDPPPDRFEGGVGCRVPTPPLDVIVGQRQEDIPDFPYERTG